MNRRAPLATVLAVAALLSLATTEPPSYGTPEPEPLPPPPPPPPRIEPSRELDADALRRRDAGARWRGVAYRPTVNQSREQQRRQRQAARRAAKK